MKNFTTILLITVIAAAAYIIGYWAGQAQKDHSVFILSNIAAGESVITFEPPLELRKGDRFIFLQGEPANFDRNQYMQDAINKYLQQ